MPDRAGRSAGPGPGPGSGHAGARLAALTAVAACRCRRRRVAAAVDEERRRARHVPQVGAVDVLGDPRPRPWRRSSSRKRSTSRPSSLGVAERSRGRSSSWWSSSRSCISQNAPCAAGRLGRLGGELGVRVDVVERQVAPDVADVAEVGQQLADDRLGPAAVRALEVAVLDDRDRRVGRAADVVALGVDRHGEVDEQLGRAEQRADPQPAGSSVGRAEDEPGERRTAPAPRVSTPSFASCELRRRGRRAWRSAARR